MMRGVGDYDGIHWIQLVTKQKPLLPHVLQVIYIFMLCSSWEMAWFGP